MENLPPLVHLLKPDVQDQLPLEEEELDSLKLKLARWVLSGFEVCLAQVKSDTESECQVGHFW